MNRLPETEPKLEDLSRTEVVYDATKLSEYIVYHLHHKRGLQNVAYHLQQQDFWSNDSFHTIYDVMKRPLDEDEEAALEEMCTTWGYDFHVKYKRDHTAYYASPEYKANDYRSEPDIAQDALGRNCPASPTTILTYLCNEGLFPEGDIKVHCYW